VQQLFGKAALGQLSRGSHSPESKISPGSISSNPDIDDGNFTRGIGEAKSRIGGKSTLGRGGWQGQRFTKRDF
jgi:hypothetical protein